jgi:hypothetical protein
MDTLLKAIILITGMATLMMIALLPMFIIGLTNNLLWILLYPAVLIVAMTIAWNINT